MWPLVLEPAYELTLVFYLPDLILHGRQKIQAPILLMLQDKTNGSITQISVLEAGMERSFSLELIIRSDCNGQLQIVYCAVNASILTPR